MEIGRKDWASRLLPAFQGHSRSS